MKKPNFPVSEAKLAELQRRMEQLGLSEDDLEEEFVLGTGAGGQKINKTSVAVKLKHLPTNIIVKCQEARSQALNRYYARKRIVEKLEEKILGEKSAKEQEIQKIRRQKRKRSKKAKEKLLESKKQTSAKKSLRKKINIKDMD